MRCQEVFDIQIHGLIQRLKAAHIKKVVIGISGGLDSTLALLVANMAYQKIRISISGYYCCNNAMFWNNISY